MEQREVIANNSNINSNKKKRILIISVLAVVIVLVIIGIIFVLQNKKTDFEGTNQQETGSEQEQIIIPEEGDQTCVSGLGGSWESPLSNGGCEQSGEKIRIKITPSDNPPIQGQICCK
jgi:hypothetical protein